MIILDRMFSPNHTVLCDEGILCSSVAYSKSAYFVRKSGKATRLCFRQGAYQQARKNWNKRVECNQQKNSCSKTKKRHILQDESWPVQVAVDILGQCRRPVGTLSEELNIFLRELCKISWKPNPSINHLLPTILEISTQCCCLTLVLSPRNVRGNCVLQRSSR